MPSTALTDFGQRLDEVDQLVDAHTALVRFKKAEAAFAQAGGGLMQAVAAMGHLVSAPKAGRPPEVQALNSAAIVLLSAHLQGFVTDIFSETTRVLFAGRAQDIDTLIDVAPVRGNPNEANITKLFASIGFRDVLAGISWQRVSNVALRRKLRDFNELRNRIAHGKAESVGKKQVERYKNVWGTFARRFDASLAKRVSLLTGTAPW